MNSRELEEFLITLIKTKLLNRPKLELKPDTLLLSTGLIDSFHLVDLALEIETGLGIHIDDTELSADTFDTVSELARLIEARK